jgi:septal ring factor EnvC (AmiA/AmiB activator)
MLAIQRRVVIVCSCIVIVHCPCSNKSLTEQNAQLRLQVAELSRASADASTDVRTLRPETARLQRELDGALGEARGLWDKVSRLEEEAERARAKAEASSREQASEILMRLDEQVRIDIHRSVVCSVLC